MEPVKKLLSSEKARNSLCRLDYAEAQKNGIPYELLETRMRMGWSVKEATTIPKNGRRVVVNNSVKYGAVTLTQEQYGEAIKNNISKEIVRARVLKLGWDKKDAVSVPLIKNSGWSKFYTEDQRLSAERNGINRNVLLRRIQNGWSAEDAISTPIGHKRPSNSTESQQVRKEVKEPPQPGTVRVVDGNPQGNGVSTTDIGVGVVLLLLIAQAISLALILGGR